MHDPDAGRCTCGACREARALGRLVRIEMAARRYLDALDAVNDLAAASAPADVYGAAFSAYEVALHAFRYGLEEEGE